MAVGDDTVCGLDIEGYAYCWGENVSGEVGDGTTEHRFVTAPVAGGHVFEAIAVGYEHACGLTSAGQLYCWGSNFHGEFGHGEMAYAPVPTPLAPGLVFLRSARD